MHIGELAEQTKTSVETLRYYEKEGLIPTPPRSEGGYRIYPESTISFVNFIRSAKSVGFTLKECRDLLAIFNSRDAHTCQEVKDLSSAKLANLEAQMNALASMHKTLTAIANACNGSNKSAAHCSILDTLQQRKLP